MDDDNDRPAGVHIAHHWLRAANQVAVGTALVVMIFLALDQRFGWLRRRPGGEAFDSLSQPIFLAVFGIGSLLALRWRLFGGGIAVFTAAGLITFAARQFQIADAVLVVIGFAVPALLWLTVGAFELRDEKFHREPGEVGRPLLYRRDVLGGVAILALTSLSGWRVGDRIFNRVFGPTHPASSAPEVVGSMTRWVWCGAVTNSSATVTGRLVDDAEGQQILLRLGTSPALDTASSFPVEVDEEQVLRASVSGLEPATRFYYAFEVAGRIDTTRIGNFTTNAVGAESFGLAFGSCSRTGSNGAVWDAIRAMGPRMMVVTGDFHYADIVADDPSRFRAVYDLQLEQPAQAAAFQQMPIGYVWDDHDWGGVDQTVGGGAAAMETYRRYVPHYPLASATSSIFQAFSVGRVRIVLTDARSSREPADDGRPGTMLGAEQKQWLLDELLSARDDHAFTIWVNPVPWISADGGGDDWNGFGEERREIADFIAANELAPTLIMVSGDAHMVALDDGTNSDFSSAGNAGFLVLHAASLDRPGGLKGGPYSHGAFPGGGQFGHLDIADDGENVRVVISGRNWANEVLVSLEWRPPSGG